eukprot:1136697-Pelagomonas_calceolata.AAC.2
MASFPSPASTLPGPAHGRWILKCFTAQAIFPFSPAFTDLTDSLHTPVSALPGLARDQGTLVSARMCACLERLAKKEGCAGVGSPFCLGTWAACALASGWGTGGGGGQNCGPAYRCQARQVVLQLRHAGAQVIQSQQYVVHIDGCAVGQLSIAVRASRQLSDVLDQQLACARNSQIVCVERAQRVRATCRVQRDAAQ